MNTPELSVLRSPSIDTELLYSAHRLVPSPDDLSALASRLGVKTPVTLTAALLRPDEQQLPLEPHFSGNPGLAGASPALPPPDVLRVYIGELSERNILAGFAHAFARQAQYNRRMRVLKGGMVAVMVEVGSGAIVQQAGSYWGLMGLPVAGATVAGFALYTRRWRNTQPVVPNLDGLESPIRIWDL